VAVSRRTFLELSGAAVLAACAEDQLVELTGPDAARADADPADAAAPDAEHPDADPIDADPIDAGAEDAKAPDADAPDADPVDAGAEDAGSVPPSAEFPLGVAAGDVLPTSAILWTKYAGTASLHLSVWRLPDRRRVHDAPAQVASGGFVHAEVGGLEPFTHYAYAFEERDASAAIARSPEGRFRSALAPGGMAPLVVGACCCTSNGRRPRTLEHAGLRTDLDLFALLGDTSYNDGARTLSEYHAKWAENLGKDGYRAMRAATSLAATWDDHEVDNNFDPERVDAGQLAAARRAFFEHLPLRREPSDADRIWKKLSWGLTLDVFVLDSRGERRPSTRRGADQYLSRAQMDWLKSELSASRAVFKLLMNSVPIADLPPLFDLALADRWDGYPTQRREILQHIDSESIGGVIWLSGDIHLAYAGKVATAGDGAGQIEILAGPGAQLPNPLSPGLRARPEQFDWARGEDNYLALHFDPVARTARAVHHDAAGAIIGDNLYTFA